MFTSDLISSHFVFILALIQSITGIIQNKTYAEPFTILTITNQRHITLLINTGTQFPYCNEVHEKDVYYLPYSPTMNTIVSDRLTVGVTMTPSGPMWY